MANTVYLIERFNHDGETYEIMTYTPHGKDSNVYVSRLSLIDGCSVPLAFGQADATGCVTHCGSRQQAAQMKSYADLMREVANLYPSIYQSAIEQI